MSDVYDCIQMNVGGSEKLLKICTSCSSFEVFDNTYTSETYEKIDGIDYIELKGSYYYVPITVREKNPDDLCDGVFPLGQYSPIWLIWDSAHIASNLVILKEADASIISCDYQWKINDHDFFLTYINNTGVNDSLQDKKTYGIFLPPVNSLLKTRLTVSNPFFQDVCLEEYYDIMTFSPTNDQNVITFNDNARYVFSLHLEPMNNCTTLDKFEGTSNYFLLFSLVREFSIFSFALLVTLMHRRYDRCCLTDDIHNYDEEFYSYSTDRLVLAVAIIIYVFQFSILMYGMEMAFHASVILGISKRQVETFCLAFFCFHLTTAVIFYFFVKTKNMLMFMQETLIAFILVFVSMPISTYGYNYVFWTLSCALATFVCFFSYMWHLFNKTIYFWSLKSFLHLTFAAVSVYLLVNISALTVTVDTYWGNTANSVLLHLTVSAGIILIVLIVLYYIMSKRKKIKNY